MQLTTDEHQKFLQSINESDFDPHYHKTWHHQFKVHDVDIVQPVPLPEKPTVKKYQSVSDFLKQHNVKDTLVRAALQAAAEVPTKSQSSLNYHTRGNENTGVNGNGVTAPAGEQEKEESSLLSASLLKKVGHRYER
jgi:hypothetical protein